MGKRNAGAAGIKLGELAGIIAGLFPPHLAESWDNVGLQIGDPAARVRRAMTCLEVTEPTLAEARRMKADAIVAHHPLVFKPMKGVIESNPAQRLVAELIRARIGLIVAHTNMDCAPWGTNQILAEACGLRPVGYLDPKPLNASPDSADFKLVIFTPQGHERAVIDAIHRGGGGRIGLYTHCTFRGAGTGTFRGGEGSDPFIGEAGKFEEAQEFRLESVVPRAARASVLAEVLKVHPYEEPAYEFYPLAGDAGEAGAGSIAEPTAPLALSGLVAQIKRRMKLKQVRVSGPYAERAAKPVKRIAICSGSGGSFIARAAAIKADAYITGEVSYHYGIEAMQRGLVVIEVGHFESERIMAGPLAEKLRWIAAIAGAGVSVQASASDLQPYQNA